ncbi:MAG TPA: PhzF family phenazine biosynthesis protein [Longimicrobiales bacterium]|nr:PhzF family phenazine biosynthesis protein [Longimicrobiales bacterium]
MDLPFLTLDVFTDHTFGGNPLGVFPGATHLPSDLMQRVAREMNLSETVFLGPPESGGDARVRIFTPGKEVPFAGHPTVGSAIYVASTLEHSPADGRRTVVLEENVGHVPVEVLFRDGDPVSARFTTAVLPEHRPSPVPDADLARLVGLETSDLHPTLRPEMVSCGLPFYVVPVASLGAIRRAVLDTPLWKRLVAPLWADHVYLICPEAQGPGVDLHVRMFAPAAGVPEDPATGSAAAALGGYLAKVDGCEAGSLHWTLEQGLEIGRPSLLHVEADRSGGATSAVRVGGSAVFVSRGVMAVPD